MSVASDGIHAFPTERDSVLHPSFSPSNEIDVHALSATSDASSEPDPAWDNALGHLMTIHFWLLDRFNDRVQAPQVPTTINSWGPGAPSTLAEVAERIESVQDDPRGDGLWSFNDVLYALMGDMETNV